MVIGWQQRLADLTEDLQKFMRGNFRELGASLTRMATLAEGGRIGEDIVTTGIARLCRDWGHVPVRAPRHF